MSLEDILKEVIPSLEDTEIENYKKALDDLGVAQAADLSLLIPQDMKGIKLIHAMKLKRYSEGKHIFFLSIFFWYLVSVWLPMLLYLFGYLCYYYATMSLTFAAAKVRDTYLFSLSGMEEC